MYLFLGDAVPENRSPVAGQPPDWPAHGSLTERRQADTVQRGAGEVQTSWGASTAMVASLFCDERLAQESEEA